LMRGSLIAILTLLLKKHPSVIVRGFLSRRGPAWERLAPALTECILTFFAGLSHSLPTAIVVSSTSFVPLAFTQLVQTLGLPRRALLALLIALISLSASIRNRHEEESHPEEK